jgi:hypothetical protein
MNIDQISRIIECEPMNIWQFVERVSGLYVRWPVTILFLASVLLYMWIFSQSWRWSVFTTVLLGTFLHWLPGMTMLGTYIAFGSVVIFLAAIDEYPTRKAKIQRELEYLPDGRLVIYKWLKKEHVYQSEDVIWRSPVWEDAIWHNRRLHADRSPRLMNESGIWGWYTRYDAETIGECYGGADHHLVRIAGENDVVFYTLGARVEDGEMLEVVR